MKVHDLPATPSIYQDMVRDEIDRLEEWSNAPYVRHPVRKAVGVVTCLLVLPVAAALTVYKELRD